MRPAKLRVLGADDARRARGFPPEDAFAPRRLRRACQREQRASLNMDGRRMGTQDRGPIRLAWRTVESAAQKGTKMSAEITMERAAELSPRWVGRLAGLLYLISGQAYSFAELSVLGKNMAPGDAAATAHNILAHETLFRMAFAAELVETILFIAVT